MAMLFHGRSRLSASRTVLVASAVVTAVIIGVRQTGFLQPLELSGFDQLTRLRLSEKPDDRLLIVGIHDQDSRARETPLTDRTVRLLLEKLEALAPRAIGLDIIRDVPVGSGKNTILEYLQLLETMQRTERLIAVCRVRDRFDRGFLPPGGLKADQIGAVNLEADPDGILRRALLTVPPPTNASGEAASVCEDSDAVLGFGLQLALRYLNVEGIALERSLNGSLKLGSTEFVPLMSPIGPYRSAEGGNQLMIHYRAAERVAEVVPLNDVLNGTLDRALVKDRIVLVGYTTPSMKDDWLTPYGHMPSVITHAQITSQILSAVLDRRPLIWFWHEWAEGVWILAWSLLGGIVAWRVRRPLPLMLAIVATMSLLVAACYALFLQAGWLPLIPPALTFLGTVGGVIFSRRYAEVIVEGIKNFLTRSRKNRDSVDPASQALPTQGEQQDALPVATVDPLLEGGLNESDFSYLTPDEVTFLEEVERRGKDIKRSKGSSVPVQPMIDRIPPIALDAPTPAKQKPLPQPIAPPPPPPPSARPQPKTPIAQPERVDPSPVPTVFELPDLLDAPLADEPSIEEPTPIASESLASSNGVLADDRSSSDSPSPAATPTASLAQLLQDVDDYYQQLKQENG